MNRGISQKSTKSKKPNQSHASSNIQKLGQRYELYLKEKEKRKKMQYSFFNCSKLCHKINVRLQSFWQKLMPIKIRGVCTEAQHFLELVKPLFKEKNNQNMEQLQKITKFLNNNVTNNSKQVKESRNKRISIYYSSQTIQCVLKSSFFTQLIQKGELLGWDIDFVFVEEGQKTKQIIQEFSQYCEQLKIKQQNEVKLVQITNRMENCHEHKEKYNIQVKQSNRSILHESKRLPVSNLGQSQSDILLPIVAPFLKGIFDETIMLEPVNIKNTTIKQMGEKFKQRQEFENQIRSRVLLKIMNQKQLKQCFPLNQMESIHKIQVSQFKESI